MNLPLTSNSYTHNTPASTKQQSQFVECLRLLRLQGCVAVIAMGACRRLSLNVKRRCGTVIKIGAGRVLTSMLKNYSNEQNKLSTVLQVFGEGP